MDKTKFNLQLFGEGAAGAGGDGGAAAGAGDNTGVQAPDAGEHRQKKRKENPLANMRYGIQSQADAQSRVAAEAGAADTEDREKPKEESFDDLIKGKHKEAFGAKVQEIIRERFRGNQENQEKLDRMQPLLEALGRKYNVDPSDMEKLAQVIDDDDSLYEQEALERGMSTDSLRTLKHLERENAAYKQREQQSLQDMRMRQHFDGLARQADEMKQLYPGFDLMTEMQNPTFARLTAPNSGIDVRTAYEAVHRDELRGAEMQYAVQKSAERMSKAIQSGSVRPNENGLNSAQGNVQIKSDPKFLNKADRVEIRRRARNGEKIAF